jgi:hypothetical protein
MVTATATATAAAVGTAIVRRQVKVRGKQLADQATSIKGPDGRRLSSRWELVTPATAAQWLADHNTRNRYLSELLAAKYASDMSSGDWQTTHQGVGFDTQGRLCDGQHRLRAIQLSGTPQWLLVTRGLGERAIEAIDRNKARSLAHTLQIMGGYESSAKLVGICRAMMVGPLTHPRVPYTDAAVKRFLDHHLAAIVWSNKRPLLNTGGVTLCAVLARAWYHASPERLDRFAEAMDDRIAKDDLRPGDATARRLKRTLEMTPFSSGSGRRTVYLKAQNALKLYLDGKDVDKLYENESDLFPLPTGSPLADAAAAAAEIAGDNNAV